jgi:hypothetical protein
MEQPHQKLVMLHYNYIIIIMYKFIMMTSYPHTYGTANKEVSATKETGASTRNFIWIWSCLARKATTIPRKQTL